MKGQGEVCPQGAEVSTQRPHGVGWGWWGPGPGEGLCEGAEALLGTEADSTDTCALSLSEHCCLQDPWGGAHIAVQSCQFQPLGKVLESQLAQTNSAANGPCSDHYHSHKKCCKNIPSMLWFTQKSQLIKAR